MQTPFSPLAFGKSFMKIHSAVAENGCLVFLWRMEKAKKQKTSVKHIRIRLIGGCVNYVIKSKILQVKTVEVNVHFLLLYVVVFSLSVLKC